MTRPQHAHRIRHTAAKAAQPAAELVTFLLVILAGLMFLALYGEPPKV